MEEKRCSIRSRWNRGLARGRGSGSAAESVGILYRFAPRRSSGEPKPLKSRDNFPWHGTCGGPGKQATPSALGHAIGMTRGERSTGKHGGTGGAAEAEFRLVATRGGDRRAGDRVSEPGARRRVRRRLFDLPRRHVHHAPDVRLSPDGKGPRRPAPAGRESQDRVSTLGITRRSRPVRPPCRSGYRPC